ncbi:MAG: SDR family NAD(P)-dependent oxidoreductase [Oleiphilus sp.]
MKKTIKHVLISGAGSGLGLGLASRYLKQGLAVSVFDLALKENAKHSLDELALAHQTKWQFYKTDISAAKQVEQNVAQAIDNFGPIHLAINSAGVLINKRMEDTSPEEFKWVIDVNLNGSFNFASAVLPHLQKGAQFALISSMAGLFSNYAYSAYGASKFGVVGLATTLRYEYEHRGIHISCVCPPEVKTPMVAAELKSGNPVSIAMKKFGGSMDADDACDQIVAGLHTQKWMIIPSLNGKLLASFARVFPTPFFALTQQVIKYTEKKLSKA